MPQEEGGPDTEDNAAPLCPTCHQLYGANPQKRKFTREVRDFWYEFCAQRFAADADRLQKIEVAIEQTATKQDVDTAFERLVERILARGQGSEETRRSDVEILEVLGEFFDKVWYDRHMNWRYRVESGGDIADPKIWEVAHEAAQRKLAKYGKNQLGPWDDFEWGMLNGKLSALRWVLGDEWDFLDT
jgi:HNH endonuclease